MKKTYFVSFFEKGANTKEVFNLKERRALNADHVAMMIQDSPEFEVTYKIGRTYCGLLISKDKYGVKIPAPHIVANVIIKAACN